MSPPPEPERNLLRRLGFVESGDKPGLWKRTHIETGADKVTRRYICCVDYRQAGAAPGLYAAEAGGKGIDRALAGRLLPLVEFQAAWPGLYQTGAGGGPSPSPQGGAGPGGAQPPLAPLPPAPAPSPPNPGGGVETVAPASDLLHYVNVNVGGRWVRGAYTEAQRREVEAQTIQRNLDLLQECAAAYALRLQPPKVVGDPTRGVLAIYEGVRRHAHHEAEARAIHRVIVEETRAAEERRRKSEDVSRAQAEARR